MPDHLTPQADDEPVILPDDTGDAEADSSHAEVVAYLGEAMEALYRYGDVEDASILLEKAAHIAPENALVHFSQGLTHYLARDFPAMLASLTKAVELDSESFQNYLMRAIAHMLMANHALALADMDAAIALKPDSHELLKQRAILYAITGDYAAALGDVDQALALAPDSGELHFFRADMLYKLGDHAAALVASEESITHDPREPEPRRLRAEIWLEQGLYEQARAAFEDLNQLEPGAEYIHVGVALARHGLGEVEKAQKMWRLLINAVNAQYTDAAWVVEHLGWEGALADMVHQFVAGL